jgi:alpha-D-xyloside xylohydrolase
MRSAALSIAVVLGCGGGSSGTGGDTTGSVDTSASSSDTGDELPAIFRLELDDASGVNSLWRDEDVLISLPPDAFVLGRVDAIDDEATYDPAHPLDVDFAAPTSVVRGSGGLLTAVLTYADGTTASVRFDEHAPGRFSALLTTSAAATTAVFRIRVRCDASDRFYGMGETFDAVEHRGTARPMQLEADLQFEGGSNEVHVPVPLLVGTRGWGVFVQDDHPGLFELGTEEDDLVQITYGMGPHADQGLRFHLYGAEHPLDITAHYWATTGLPVAPAPWALGPWLWRNENTDAAQVIADAETLRDLDLAHSALWIDRPYATGVNTFDFDATRFADPAEMIAALHDLGLRVALWHSPYVSTMDEPAADLAMEAEANGYYPEQYGILLNAWSAPPIDFTNPDAYDWWSGLLSDYAALGIEGYKLDYGEDVVTGLATARVPWLFADGSDERTMHGRYHSVYHAPYADALPDSGGFILARAGTWGEQTQSSVIWPGDLDADLSRFGELRDGSLGVGGLPSALHAGLSLSPSGFPLFASDTGGYRDSPPTKETFTRWFEHAALMPVMQIGTGSSTVAWEFDGTDFDDEMLGWYRDYTRLHLRLFPLFWTGIQGFADGGRPIVRPLGLAYPELGVHPSDVYLLGDDLLVAPIVDPGVVERTVTLPPGEWIRWFDGDTQSGEVTVDAPLGKVPLWIRAGGIVPMLRPTIDTLSPTGQPDRIDSFATDAGKLWPRIALGPASAFTLYDGTTITVDESTITWTDGEVFVQGAVIEVHGFGAAPQAVTLDGAALEPTADVDALAATPGWFHAGTTLWIGVGAGSHTMIIAR